MLKTKSRRILAFFLAFLLLFSISQWVFNLSFAASEIIYEEDFQGEDLILGELPAGYTKSNDSAASVREAGVSNEIKKSDSTSNQSFENRVKNSGRNTAMVTYAIDPIKMKTGLLEFNTKVYTQNDAYEKYIDILNTGTDGAGANRVLRLTLKNNGGQLGVYYTVPNHSESVVEQTTNITVTNNVWTNIKVLIDTDKKTGSIKIGENAAIPVDFKLKDGTALTIGGFATTIYYRAAAGAEAYVYLDDIVIKKANLEPTVKTPILNQSGTVGQELTVDLTDVFEDGDNDTLTLTATNGAISGLTYSLTPTEEGKITETIRATDVDGAYVETTFDIDVIRAGADIIYETTFEDETVGTLPTGYTANALTLPNPPPANYVEPVRAIADDVLTNDGQSNKSLKNSNKVYSANKTSDIKMDLQSENEGLISYSASVYTAGDAFTKGMYFINTGVDSAAARILNIFFTNATGNNYTLTYQVPNHSSLTTQINVPNIVLTKNKWVDFRVTFDTVNKKAQITFADYAPIEIDMELKSTTKYVLGGFVSTTYYRAATAAPTNLYYDNIIIRQVIGNNEPFVANAVQNTSIKVENPVTIDLSNVFNDADGDTIGITSSKGTVKNNILTYTPSTTGEETIVLRAIDGKGGVCETEFILTVTGNNTPTVVSPISDEYTTVETEFMVDLSGVFADIDEEGLVYESSVGTIEDSIFKFTPTEVGTTKITVTAKDPEDASCSLSFYVIANSKTGENSVIFKDDFEAATADKMPTDWILNSTAGLHPEGFIKTISEVDNQYLMIKHHATSAGTINVKKYVPLAFSGDYQASFDFTFGGVSTKRYVEFLNQQGVIVFGVGVQGDQNKFSVRIGPTKYVDIPNLSLKLDEKYSVYVDYKRDEKKVYLKINNIPMGEYDLKGFSDNIDDLSFGSVNLSSYYRAATNASHYFKVDNFLINANLLVDERDEHIVKKDFDAFDWYAVSKEPIDKVTSPLNFRKSAPYGSTIRWISSNKNYIFDNGMVVRDANSNKTVTVTAVFQSGNAQLRKNFDITILKAENQTLQEEYKDDFETYQLDSVPDGWFMPPTSNVMHAQTGVKIVNDPEAGGTRGKVYKHTNAHIENQTYSGFTFNKFLPKTYVGETEISFDARFDSNAYDTSIRFYNSDNAIIFAIGGGASFFYNVNSENVAISTAACEAKKWYNIRLVLNNDTGFVSWFVDGKLIAAFKPTENLTKNYSLSQIGVYSWIRQAIVGSCYIDNLVIKDNKTHKLLYALSKIDLDATKSPVTTDFDLPLTGAYNTSFNWTSDNANCISIDQFTGKATVTRPAANETDATVKLTATATLEGITKAMDFEVVVKKHLSDQEAVDSFYEKFNFSYLSLEPIDGVTSDFDLVKIGEENVDLSYESLDTSAIKILNNKAVITQSEQDKNVKLNVTLKRGEVSRVMTLNITVVKTSGDLISKNSIIKKYTSDIVGYGNKNALDANLGTIWKTLPTDDAPYMIFDLGVRQNFDRWVISTESNVKEAILYVSTDNINFKQVSKVSPRNDINKIERSELSFSPANGRYIKVELVKGTKDSVGVREIQLYNSNLTDKEAVGYADKILNIPYSHQVENNLDLSVFGSHGTSITWQSSNSSIIGTDGTVVRPNETTKVILTATIVKGEETVKKEIEVTVIAKGTSMPNDLNDLKPIDYEASSMTDQELFGLWLADRNQWDIDHLPRINYDHNPQLKEIEGYVKQGNYDAAKSLFIAYYKTRDFSIGSTITSRDYGKADLYINDIFFNPNSIFINSFTTPKEYADVNVDVSTYVKKGGKVGMYVMQKLKHEPQAEFYTQQAGEHEPELIVTINGNKKTYKAVKDTYVSPEENINENYGLETRMYVKETMDLDIENSTSKYPKIWTKDTKRAYMMFDLSDLPLDAKITNATLKLHGKADGGTSDMLVWGHGDTIWKEDTFTWADSLATVFSWNGTTPDFMSMPKTAAEGSDFSTYMMITRASWLSTLTGIYNATGDEYYAYHAMRLMNNFIYSTRDYVDCYNLQDAGIRAQTLVYTFDILKKSQHLTNDAAISMLKNLYQLNKALTYRYNFAPDHNHGTFANRGLMRITLYLPEAIDYDDNVKLFSSRWNDQARYLINDDGSYRESSFSYAQTVANIFLGVLEDAKTFNFELEPYYIERVSKLPVWIAHSLYPDGKEPQFGDGDSATNHLSTIKSFDNYLDQPEMRYMYTNGKEGTHPGYTSKYYPGSNKYIVMKDNYTEDATIAQTNLGIGDGRSHTHFDNLSMVAYAYGKPLLVDNGRYSYSETDAADWVRYTSESHNVVTMNGLKQGIVTDIVNQFYTNDSFDYLNGTSNATYDTTGKYPWNRTIFFPKSKKFFIVNDKIAPTNGATNKIEQNWHFLPDSYWTYDEDTKKVETHFEEGANVEVVQVDNNNTLVEKKGYYSPGTSSIFDTTYPVFMQNKQGIVNYDTVIFPKDEGSKSTAETERIELGVDQSVATAFNVNIKETLGVQENIYYQSYESQPTVRNIGNLTYDGLSMFIEKNMKKEIESISLIDGSHLQKDGVSLVKLPKKVSDISVYYEGTNIKLDSGSLTANDLDKVEIYAPGPISNVKFKGLEISFKQEGNKVTLSLLNNSGNDKLTPVFNQDTRKMEATTSDEYNNVVSYKVSNKEYSATYSIGENVLVSSADAWDGYLPKLVLNKNASVDTKKDVLAAFKLSNTDLEVNKVSKFYIETDNKVGYIKDKKFSESYVYLASDSIEDANSSLQDGQVGIYKGNGFATIYTKAPIELVVFKDFLTPPGANTGGGGGGGVDPTPTEKPDPTPTPTPTPGPDNKFTDTTGHWAYEEINKMVDLGVLKGTSDTTFEPDKQVTRAEFAAMVTRLLKLESGTNDFKDVKKDDWFNESVSAVLKAGIMNGADGYFRPYDNITREEMTKVLIVAYESKKGKVEVEGDKLSKFSDKSTISPWAENYMAAAVELGLITGTSDVTISPKDYATRAQGAVMFSRLNDLLTK